MILLGMTRHTKKKIGKLRGGAVEHLNAAEMGIADGRELRNKVDMYAIDAHGSTTRDNKFLVVPENTFMFFTSRSGLPAKGNTPSQDVYLSYRNESNRNSYYDRMHTQLFKPYAERVATGRPQYPQNLFVYEPGDILPDYLLSFNNTVVFMFKHGVYRLPIPSIPGSEGMGSLIGRPLYFIKMMHMQGRLTDADLEDLNDVDREKLRTMDLAALKDGPTTETRDIRRTALWRKIEGLCCRDDESNLLFQPPFLVDRFRENDNAMRLSTVLKNIPYDTSKPYRFFFMLFCRISYQDVVSGLSARELEVPRLLRTLSASGKCSFDTRDAAFNLLRIRRIFCELPIEIKDLMIGNEEIRDLIRILKKATYPPGGDMNWWRSCLDGTYDDLSTTERSYLFENYMGYLDIEDMRKLIELFNFFKREVGHFKRRERVQQALVNRGNANAKVAVANIQRIIKAYQKLGSPFMRLSEQLEKQTGIMDRYIAEKRALIRDIYKAIHKPYQNKGITTPTHDYLYLVSNTPEDLRDFLSRLQQANKIQSMKNNAENITNSYTPAEIQELLEKQFIGFSGSQLVSRIVEDFEIEPIEDTSITIENSNNTEGAAGGRRKTKKKSRK